VNKVSYEAAIKRKDHGFRRCGSVAGQKYALMLPYERRALPQPV